MLPITLAQVEADNTLENVLNEIRQITYSFQAKEITTKVYYKMGIVFKNFKDS